MEKFQIGKKSDTGYVQIMDGIERKTLLHRDSTLLTEFRFKEGKFLPSHKHPHEQTGYLLSGHVILIVAGKRNELLPGDSWSIEENIEHSAEILEDSVAVEVFSPVFGTFA